MHQRLRPDQLLKVAEALNVSVKTSWVPTERKSAGLVQPAGCVSYSKLPRSQQQKITALLEAFIAHNRSA